MKRNISAMLLALLVLVGGCGGIALLGTALGLIHLGHQIADIADYISGNPDVTLTVLLDGYVVRTNAPNTKGSLDLGGLPEGTFLLGIVAPDHRSGWQKKVTVSASGSPVSVVPVIGPAITGTVTRQATTGGTVPAARVLVAAFYNGAQILANGQGPLDITAGSTQDYQLALTNDQGQFVLGPCDQLGDWLVTAYSAGYQADAVVATVGAGVDALNLSLNLATDTTSARPATMTGTVTGATTSAVLANALVRAEPAAPAEPLLPASVVTQVEQATSLTLPPGPWFQWGFTATTSGSNGTFSLDFPAGSVRVWAYKYGYQGAYQQTSAAPGGSLPEDFQLPSE